MSTIYKMNNSYQNIQSITLTNGVNLNTGLLYASGTIDGLVVTNTTITTVPITVSGAWYITDIIFDFISTTGLTGTMVASIGTNAATYNNIMPSTTFTGWNQTTDQYRYQVSGVAHKCFSSDVIKIDITTAFGGGGSVLFNVYLIGQNI